MKRLWTGKTARQEVIAFASIRLRLNRHHGWTASDSVEHCLEGWENHSQGTIHYEIGRYVTGLSDAGYNRLCSEVKRAAK